MHLDSPDRLTNVRLSVPASCQAMPEESSGSTIRHFEFGTGNPLLVLHGLPLDHRSAEAMLEPVFQYGRRWRRIYIDLPGHGDSPAQEWIRSNDEMVEAVAAFVESSFPHERFALAAHSYGAYLARGLTRRFADRMLGLMMWVPASYPRNARRRPPPVVLRRDPAAMAELSSDWEKFYGELMVIQDPEAVDVAKGLLAPAAERSNEEFLDKVAGTKFTFVPEEGRFLRPTLIVCGRQDSLVGFEDQFDLLDRFPRATYAVIDSAGHLLGASEQNEVFRSLVSDWLTRMEIETEQPSRD